MRAAAALLASALAACAAGPEPSATPRPTTAPAAGPRLVALPNADFEASYPAGERCPPRWGCKSHADPNSHRFSIDEAAPAGGKRSLCIERVTKEPWALATLAVSDRALRGARVRFSLQVRADGVEGGGGAFVLVHGPSGNLHHDQRLVRGKSGWEPMAIEFNVPANAQIVEVGATLEGAGRICLDDARLEILSP